MLPYKSLGDLLKNKAKQNHQTYLYWKDAALSFLKLNAVSNQVASNFLQAGLQKGDKVALLLHNCPEFIFSFWGCAKAGMVAVPIDINLSQEEVVHIINDSGARLLVCEFGQMETIAHLRLRCPLLENIYYTDCAHASISSFDHVYLSSEHYPLPHVSGEDLMSIAYTAGTSGKPKGVMITHYNFLSAALAFSQAIGLQAEDKLLCASALSYLPTQVVCIVAPMLTAISVALAGDSPAAETLQDALRQKATLLYLNPSFLNSLHTGLGLQALPFLRAGICIGAPLNEETIQTFVTNFNVPLWLGYELTEATGLGTLGPMDLEKGKAASLGKPLPGLEFKVVDEAGKMLEGAEIGEIVISGPSVAKGYWGDAELTAQIFMSESCFTGDLAYLEEEGELYLIGRKNDNIAKGGERIYPHVIEEVLYRHPEVMEAVVIGLPDPTWGEEIVAFIVPKESSTLDEEEILRFCGEALSDLKCPGMIKFVDMLPKTTTGKIQRAKLKAHYGSPVISD